MRWERRAQAARAAEAADETALRELLTAAAAPATADELRGEDAALAAFVHASSAAPSGEPAHPHPDRLEQVERRRRRLRGLARTPRALAVLALGTVAGGAVATAAVTGQLPAGAPDGSAPGERGEPATRSFTVPSPTAVDGPRRPDQQVVPGAPAVLVPLGADQPGAVSAGTTTVGTAPLGVGPAGRAGTPSESTRATSSGAAASARAEAGESTATSTGDRSSVARVPSPRPRPDESSGSSAGAASRARVTERTTGEPDRSSAAPAPAGSASTGREDRVDRVPVSLTDPVTGDR